MSIRITKEKLKNGSYSNIFSQIYSSSEEAATRYCEACDEYQKLYGDGDVMLFSAPGRTEVGGNHTDHQHGRVLAGSVDFDVIAVAAKSDDNTVKIKSKGFPEDVVCIDELACKAEENGQAISLIRGILAEFKARGYKIGGFTAYTTSNVLKGSGLSSSAAFEIAVCVMINGLFNNGRMDPIEMAVISQIAENKYYGKPSGLMDQMASSVGGFIAIDFYNNTQPLITKIDFDFKKSGHKLCIVNTGGNHVDLTDDYAAIIVECKQISNALSVEHLRYADKADFYSRIGELRKKYGDRAVLRAIHFFDEDQRADLEKVALLKKDFNRFLQLINKSGNSSYKYLQNVFSVSCPAEQGLSLALALTEKFLDGRGACRVHGGGFAGTIQCFIPDDMINEYKEMIEAVFGKGNCYVLNIRPFGGCQITEN